MARRCGVDVQHPGKGYSVIEETAIIFGNSKVSDEAYVGHFCLIGNPRRISVDATTPAFGPNGPWENSRGSTIHSRVVVSAYCHIDDGSVIGEGTWIGSRCRIGHDSIIGKSVQIYYSCQIYDRVHVADNAVIGGFVCNDARIGSGSQVFGNLIHRLVDAPSGGADPLPTETEPAPVVGSNVVIGMGAIIIGGITVADGAYVAAGSVLTHDAEPNTLYTGNPARARGAAPKPFRGTEP